MLSPQQAEVKSSLITSAVLLAHIYSPSIPSGSSSTIAEGIVATQVERWYQWLLQAYKDETVFTSPDAPTGVAPIQGTPLVSALIAAIPGLDATTKAALAAAIGPLVSTTAAAVVQAATSAIPLPASPTTSGS